MAARINRYVAKVIRLLSYLVDMPRLLCSVRLALHLVRRIIQRFRWTLQSLNRGLHLKQGRIRVNLSYNDHRKLYRLLMHSFFLFVLLSIPISVQAEAELLDKRTQIRQLEKVLNRIQDESQSTYQQFLMIQELRRNEMSESPALIAPSISPDKSIPIPKYEDLIQQRQEKQARIKNYATELDELFRRYKDLESEKYSILEQIKALEQKPEE